MANKCHHFLMVTIAAQGHINPARHLARRLAKTTGARVTLATPLSSHRCLFPDSSAAAGELDDATEEAHHNLGSGVIAYAPYSDGFDNGFHPDTGDANMFMERIKSVGSYTLAALVRNFVATGRPVTCVLYTILLTWATDVARDLEIPAILYWIQSASVFAVYYHYFHRRQGFTSATVDNEDYSHSMELPGLTTLGMNDLSLLIGTPNPFLAAHKEIFMELDKSEKPLVLMNTFYQLEASAIEGIPKVELLTIGPVVDKSHLPVTTESRDLFEDDVHGYMKWLDVQKERSVVYVAFGSVARLAERQVEELEQGLKESGRPYLWVLRKDCRPKGTQMDMVLKDGKGIIVEWCSQVKVLDHKAVGCFVTHGGWNSTSEAVVSGVPMIILPQWLDQATNARLVEAAWGIGVRVKAREDGIVEALELRNGLDAVMGEGERASEIRGKVEEWKVKARAALTVEGSSSKNLKAFADCLSG